MKKSIFETPEMEKNRLEREISDLKNQHKLKSDELLKNSLSLLLREITYKKKVLADMNKVIIKKQERYHYLCTPSLF